MHLPVETVRIVFWIVFVGNYRTLGFDRSQVQRQHLAILCDAFYPLVGSHLTFEKVTLPSRKGHFDSPGIQHFLLNPVAIYQSRNTQVEQHKRC